MMWKTTMGCLPELRSTVYFLVIHGETVKYWMDLQGFNMSNMNVDPIFFVLGSKNDILLTAFLFYIN